MKTAFTMIELVFVIIILGILSFSIAPSFERDNASLAFEQMKSHLELAQQLALDNDSYIADSRFSESAVPAVEENEAEFWFRKHPQMIITGNTYTVFSDAANNTFNGTVDVTDVIARNPLDKTLIQDIDIETLYGVTLAMSQCNGVQTNIIAFDYLGRPHCRLTDGTNAPYANLATAAVTITLSENGNNRVITIEPTTGYIH
jgi:prepilin-type N-terminal cleavage/methylation domain-containing protein